MTARSHTKKSLTRGLMLGGAAALALAGAAHAENDTAAEAQANNPPEGSRNWGEEARVNTAEGAPGVAADGTVIDPESAEATEPDTAEADVASEAEIAQAARVRGDVEAETTADAGAPGDGAVDELMADAQAEGAQNDAHIIPTETDETAPAAQAGTDVMLAAHPGVVDGDGETTDVALLQTFLAMDADEDLLLTPAEWSEWQGWDGQPGPDFAEIDINATGAVGFGEYRVWNAIRAEKAEAGS